MSFSEGHGKDYGELLEDDETRLIIGDTCGSGRNERVCSPINVSSELTDRFSAIRSPSEISMDLSDLQLEDDFIPLSDRNDFSSFYAALSPIATKECQEETQQQPLARVDEQADNESSMSMTTMITPHGSSSQNSIYSSDGSLNNRRKVKFEISTRLEDIQEYEKPDIEDYHMLYYTAHELQRMIDGRRAEEQREQRVVR